MTIFGDGSGATSILAMLSLEDTKGLFQKAWLVSPSPKIDITRQQAERQNSGFVRYVPLLFADLKGVSGLLWLLDTISGVC